MNIVCMISSLKLGGAERQMLGLADVLQKEGHRVEILTYHEAAFFAPASSVYSIAHHYIERKGTLLGFLNKVAAHLDDFSCDVLIAFKAGCSLKACALKLMRPSLRLFVSERNLNLIYWPHDAFRFLAFKVCAEKVVCNCYSQETFIMRHFPSLRGKVLTIRNFIDNEQFHSSPAEPHSPRKIIVTARISWRKNMDGLIRAAEILKAKEGVPGFVIYWYGMSRQSRYLEKMLKMIHGKRLSDVFRIHSAVADVESEYRDADIFCLPSFYEGTSNSLAEALSCGKVAVCSDVSDNHLYIKNGVNGFLFNPHSPESIAEALEKALLMDRNNILNAGTFSSNLVCKELSMEKFAASYLAMIDCTK